jgi:hypothetical protein
MTTTLVAAGSAALRRLSAGAVRPPNRLAEQITGRTYLSHSQLSLMRTCPRKFAFLCGGPHKYDYVAFRVMWLFLRFGRNYSTTHVWAPHNGCTR